MLIQKSPLYIYSKPFPIRRPKEGWVTGRTKPNKPSVASKEIACAVYKVPTRINGVILLDNICIYILGVFPNVKHLEV